MKRIIKKISTYVIVAAMMFSTAGGLQYAAAAKKAL